MLIANLVDPATGFPGQSPCPSRELRQVEPAQTQAMGESFLSARTTIAPLVARAHEELAAQTDRAFAALTDPQGRYRMAAVGTREIAPYDGAEELIASLLDRLGIATAPR